MIDAANYVEPGRDLWRALATKHQVEMRIIECVISDERVHRARLVGRDRGLAIGEPSWEAVERQRAEWIPWVEERLLLDSTEPIEANFARALAYMGAEDGSAFERDKDRPDDDQR